MRPSLLVPALAGALLLTAAPAAAARTAAVPVDEITVDSTAPLTATGHPTLTGSYRCAPAAGPVFLSVSLSQADPRVHHGIGSTSALCDGATHRWTRTDTGTRTYAAGTAHVQVSLVELSATGLPLPRVHRIAEGTVTLAATP
ncbi:DUF6299 family protein [Streptomyces jietaisiensis]|uniref:DUF6299 family protein n=1 Tax=Streptomyces griseoaurantiacus TaxID=68213 RepID=A0ABZ1UYS1_9ACTN|nr:DUF6299 family protein [Streptomyces jietaisiensis]